MISSQIEYQKAQQELDYLKGWLARLASDTATERRGFTVASIEKMISRIQSEIVDYDARKPDSKNPAEPNEEQVQPGSEDEI